MSKRDELDVMMVCETHLQPALAKDLADRMKQSGLASFYEAADRTGRSQEGTTAGIVVLVRSDWYPTAADADLVQLAGRGHPLAQRWVAAELRLSTVAAMLIECYSVTRQSMKSDSLEILKQLSVLIKAPVSPRSSRVTGRLSPPSWQAQAGRSRWAWRS